LVHLGKGQNYENQNVANKKKRRKSFKASGVVRVRQYRVKLGYVRSGKLKEIKIDNLIRQGYFSL